MQAHLRNVQDIKIPYFPYYFANVEQHKIDAEELKQWLQKLKLAGDLDAMNCFVKRVDKNGK
jgi:arsenate reductase-like glutaredoxin family protein